MKVRIYAKPGDEKAFLDDLSGQGTYVVIDGQPTGEPLNLYDLVTLCYWSKGSRRAVEIDCEVVGRRLAHNNKMPRSVKVKAVYREREQIRALQDEV